MKTMGCDCQNKRQRSISIDVIANHAPVDQPVDQPISNHTPKYLNSNDY